MSVLLTGVLIGPPLQPGRDQAARAAQQELSKQIYQQAQPSLLERVLQWLQDQFDQLTTRVASAVPGGWWGLVVIVLLFVLVVVLVRWRVGGLARTLAVRPVVFGGTARSAAQHRAAADRAAAEGRWDEAVLERFRAVVRQLEERAVIDERAGRTADEAALDGGRLLPECAAALRTGASLFDDVAYGSVPAGPEGDRALRDLDESVRAARPALASR